MIKWICQTFWTKPMSEKHLLTNSNIAKLSLYYAHRSGYYVKMHTDSKGFDYLKDFGYDELVTDLDTIPEYIPNKIFAYSKYIALKNDPLGYVHTDFDVFIKKPCLDEFYSDSSYDIILQNRETEHQCFLNDYIFGRNFFMQYPVPKGFHPEHLDACNVGVIGFNSYKLRNIYLTLYEKCAKFYCDKTEQMSFIPDLFFEQINIDYLIHLYKSKVYFILPRLSYSDIELHKIAKEVGYQHLLGGWKYSDKGITYIQDYLDNFFSYKKSNLKVIWSCPCTGKSILSQNNPKYLDFDTIKNENNLILNTNRYLQDHYANYLEQLFKLFKETLIKYDESEMILLVSDTEILHSFYMDFDKIYCLDSDVMKERMMERNDIADQNIDQWAEMINENLDNIKKHRDIIKINTYLSEILN